EARGIDVVGVLMEEWPQHRLAELTFKSVDLQCLKLVGEGKIGTLCITGVEIGQVAVADFDDCAVHSSAEVIYERNVGRRVIDQPLQNREVKDEVALNLDDVGVIRQAIQSQ